jgi:hypothetical protein
MKTVKQLEKERDRIEQELHEARQAEFDNEIDDFEEYIESLTGRERSIASILWNYGVPYLDCVEDMKRFLSLLKNKRRPYLAYCSWSYDFEITLETKKGLKDLIWEFCLSGEDCSYDLVIWDLKTGKQVPVKNFITVNVP